MSNTISTKTLPGFMELLPAQQIAFDKMKAIIQNTYESFGFIPIDTPAIERSEVLLAKAGGETEKQIYRFTKGENDLSLRFDLTVPLARYVSEHYNDLVFPFRRYHIAKVYRGEKPQKGRYREFYQCDIDIIGRDKLSLVNDAELLSVIYNVFMNLGLPKFMIRISNRKLIIGLLDNFKLKEKAVEVMRIIDKIDKIGSDIVKETLLEMDLPNDVVKKIMEFVAIKGAPKEVISALKKLKIKNEQFLAGIEELSSVINYVESFNLPKDSYGVDLSIARGLDYYTGTVYETILVDYPQVGSICSGGRYESLADNYSTNKLPGVGISIGLTRLFSQLEELGLVKIKEATTSQVLIIPFDASATSLALKTGAELRAQKIATEIYFEDAKFNNKLSYANKLGVKYVVLIGEDEIKGNFFTVKNMVSGEQKKLDAATLITESKN